MTTSTGERIAAILRQSYNVHIPFYLLYPGRYLGVYQLPKQDEPAVVVIDDDGLGPDAFEGNSLDLLLACIRYDRCRVLIPGEEDEDGYVSEIVQNICGPELIVLTGAEHRDAWRRVISFTQP